MVQMKCECSELQEVEINSLRQFQEIKEYFEKKASAGKFEDLLVDKPYYVGYSVITGEMRWYADKWYKCNECDLIWEIIYPDFPAKGKVRRLNVDDNYVHTLLKREK